MFFNPLVGRWVIKVLDNMLEKKIKNRLSGMLEFHIQWVIDIALVFQILGLFGKEEY